MCRWVLGGCWVGGPDLVLDVGDDTPVVNRLAQNVPNPFNPTTTIVFTLVNAHDVTLRIYNATGQLVRILVNGRRSADHHAVTWDGRDRIGREMPSGTYLYRVDTGTATGRGKITLAK